MKLLVPTIMCVLLVACSREPASENRVAASFHAEELPENHQVDLSQRQLFPFSVVPGGTFNQAEVKQRVAQDPVVKQHYQGIDIAKLKPFRLTQPAQGYVSFRIGDRIFWTSRRLYLKPGEILLSDGLNILRGRCGNRVSLTPQVPILPKAEPTQAAFELPGLPPGAFDPSEFQLPGNGPQAFIAMEAKVPESIFEVAPPVVGPGKIGGALPGGLPGTGRDGEVLILLGYNYVFPLQRPILDNPTFAPPPAGSVLIAINTFPPFFVNNPTGPGAPPLIAFEPPVFAGPAFAVPGVLPPVFNISTFLVSGGSPPLVVASATTPVPPGGSTAPIGGPNPDPNPNPPEIQKPPTFELIPEPSTLWMVGLAALMLAMLRPRLSPRQAPFRNSDGQPLRRHTRHVG